MKSAQTAVVTPTLTQRWKAIRPLVMIFFFSLSIMIATALIPRDESDYSSLSPSNPGNSGSQALADAMRHHGVKVIHIHSIQELVARSTPETTAVITDPEDLTTRILTGSSPTPPKAAGRSVSLQTVPTPISKRAKAPTSALFLPILKLQRMGISTKKAMPRCSLMQWLKSP